MPRLRMSLRTWTLSISQHQPAGVLEVLEDDDLTDAHDLAVDFGDYDVTALATGLFNGRPSSRRTFVTSSISGISEPPRTRIDGRRDVVMRNGAYERHRRLLARIDRGEDADDFARSLRPRRDRGLRERAFP